MNRILWSPNPEKVEKSKMNLFMRFVNQSCSQSIESYPELHRWSVDNLELFWKLVSDFLDICYSSRSSNVMQVSDKIYQTKWFLGAKLNYAENILRDRPLDSVSIEFFNELNEYRSLTYRDLCDEVASVSTFFKSAGLSKGDRVAAMMPNIPETVVGALACASFGGIWSSCSPDFGKKAIIDRFEQIEPKILIACDSYTFKGKMYKCIDKIKYLVSSLKSVEKVIIVKYRDVGRIEFDNSVYWDEIPATEKQIAFEQMDFGDPLYIMFSSGTTGKPKSIVHSVGGTLIQHVKELGFHCDLSQNEKILYYTTCGWMMWNWLLSGLYFKSTIVLYEGSPFFPKIDSLIDLVDKNKINIFGTSAKYIAYLLSSNINIKDSYKLNDLRSILSTGSTLTPEDFDYVYNKVKSDVQLSSISGGTDIISCFALGNPILKVRRGELQCVGLGMNVFSYSPEGNSIKNQKGELVCTSPFPSMPIYFWKDCNNLKYQNAYFNKYQNVWTHGDFIEIKDDGGVVIYGRSDATLNPGGVRIGTAEIYSAISVIPYIDDSIAVNSLDEDSYILFVKTSLGKELESEHLENIRTSIKENLSPKHLPSKIVQVSDIPYTVNGKKTEIAVRKTLLGESLDNIDSLSNPECLKDFKIDT